MLKIYLFSCVFICLIFALLQAENEENLQETLDSILFQSTLSDNNNYQKEEIPILNYEEQKKWSGLCQTGKNQSPINIKTNQLTKPDEEDKLEVRYDNVRIAEIINVGATLVLTMKGHGSVMRNGIRYMLEYAIVHIPSEHAINNKRALVELQAVHKSYYGDYLVASVLFYEGGSNKSLLQTLLAAPENAGERKPFNEKINREDFFPNFEKGYYYYSGSLTIPPCTENTTWLIMKDTKFLYKTRLEVWFRRFKPNFRNIQILGNRKIYDY